MFFSCSDSIPTNFTFDPQIRKIGFKKMVLIKNAFCHLIGNHLIGF